MTSVLRLWAGHRFAGKQVTYYRSEACPGSPRSLSFAPQQTAALIYLLWPTLPVSLEHSEGHFRKHPGTLNDWSPRLKAGLTGSAKKISPYSSMACAGCSLKALGSPDGRAMRETVLLRVSLCVPRVYTCTLCCLCNNDKATPLWHKKHTTWCKFCEDQAFGIPSIAFSISEISLLQV